MVWMMLPGQSVSYNIGAAWNINGTNPYVPWNAPSPNLTSNRITKTGLTAPHAIDVSYRCGIVEFKLKMNSSHIPTEDS